MIWASRSSEGHSKPRTPINSFASYRNSGLFHHDIGPGVFWSAGHVSHGNLLLRFNPAPKHLFRITGLAKPPVCGYNSPPRGEWFSPSRDEGTMAKPHLTALDADIIRSAFLKEVHESKAPESQWREMAMQLIQSYTGQMEVDPDMLDWIIRRL